MEQTFLTEICIKKVRHLQDITIPLDSNKRKHLILTGKNGSGKTSVLEALVRHFSIILNEQSPFRNNPFRPNYFSNRAPEKRNEHGAVTKCTSFPMLQEKYAAGEFILAYFKAERLAKVEISSSIEQITPGSRYSMTATPGEKFVKYMVSLKATQAFALQKKDDSRAEEIESWFAAFERILQKIFGDPTLKLDFNIENFQFHILQKDREPFDFNTMSSGYSAVFNIINDLIMRLGGDPSAKKEGIVLIDEIDTHLHLELQRTILPFLTELFPNIQFIVSTHSPFILNSVENAVIFDLETKKIVRDGLANYPYNGIVESFFNTDMLSAELRNKYDRYKELTAKADLQDTEYAEIMDLETELDEIPDFLSPDIASEYSRIKLEFSNRE